MLGALSVADALGVEPVDGLAYLLHEDGGLLLGVGTVLHQPLEELPTRHELRTGAGGVAFCPKKMGKNVG